MSYLLDFLKHESGAITLDWVILTSAIASFGIAISVGVGSPAKDLNGEVVAEIQDVPVIH